MKKHEQEQMEREVIKIETQRGADDYRKGKYDPPVSTFNFFPSDEKITRDKAYHAGRKAASE